MSAASFSSTSRVGSLYSPSSCWSSSASFPRSGFAAFLISRTFIRWCPGNGPGPLHGRISGYPQNHLFPIFHRGRVLLLHFTGVADFWITKLNGSTYASLPWCVTGISCVHVVWFRSIPRPSRIVPRRRPLHFSPPGDRRQSDSPRLLVFPSQLLVTVSVP